MQSGVYFTEAHSRGVFQSCILSHSALRRTHHPTLRCWNARLSLMRVLCPPQSAPCPFVTRARRYVPHPRFCKFDAAIPSPSACGRALSCVIETAIARCPSTRSTRRYSSSICSPFLWYVTTVYLGVHCLLPVTCPACSAHGAASPASRRSLYLRPRYIHCS